MTNCKFAKLEHKKKAGSVVHNLVLRVEEGTLRPFDKCALYIASLAILAG